MKHASTTLLMVWLCCTCAFAQTLPCEEPNASLEFKNGETFCSGAEIVVTNNTEDPDSLIDFYIWDWDDGTIDTVFDKSVPQHQYFLDTTQECPSIARYTVTLRTFNVCENGAVLDGNNKTEIRIVPPPEIITNLGPQVLCLPNRSLGLSAAACPENDPTMTYLWDFGDGNTSTEQNPNHTFPGPGVYTVTLRATNRCGLDEETFTVTVGEAPDIDAERLADSTAATGDGPLCAFSPALYRNNSTGFDTAMWQIVNDTVGASEILMSTTDSFVVTFNRAGTYVVGLTLINDGCSSDPWLDTIEVAAAPFVDLALDTSDCNPPRLNPADFLILQGAYDSIQWDWSGGSFRGPDPGPITFNSDDRVILRVFNSCQERIDTGFINLIVPGTANIAPAPQTDLCETDSPIQLAATPSGGRWRGPGVNNQGRFDPQAAGVGTHLLIYGNDCLDPDTIQLVVRNSAVAIQQTDPTLCIDAGTVNFTANLDGGQWSGRGITDPDAGAFDPNIAGEGRHFVIYDYRDPSGLCRAFDTIAIEVIEPRAGFVVDSCAGSTLFFDTTGLSPYDQLTWNFGDNATLADSTAPAHDFPRPGTYLVQLVARLSTCTALAEREVTVEAPANARFDLTERDACAPFDLQVEDRSSGDNLRYQWWVDTLSLGTFAEPTPFRLPIVDTTTTIPVRLELANNCGTSAYVDSFVVRPQPVARFGPNFDRFCSGQEVELTNASYGEPDAFEWILPDGRRTNRFLPPPQLFFTDSTAREIPLTLIVSNECGADTVSEVIQIVPTNVEAGFNLPADTLCQSEPFTATNLATGNVPVRWELSDGSVYTGDTITHQFDGTGRYTITQIAFGCGIDSASTVVDIVPGPDPVLLHPPLSCPGTPVRFQVAGDGADFLLDFGDGASTENAFQHVYDRTGIYDLELLAISRNGCRASRTSRIEIVAAPEARFTVTDSLCGNAPVTFAAHADPTWNTFWAFSNGERSTGDSLIQYFPESGIQSARLIVQDTLGCVDTAFQTFFTYPRPKVFFEVEKSASCGPTEVFFQNQSRDADLFSWSFTTGDSSRFTNPILFVSRAGQYEAKLVAANVWGCRDSLVLPFGLEPSPQVDLVLDSISCWNANDGSILVTSEDDYELLLFDGSTTRSFVGALDGLGPARYELRVRAGEGCDTTLQFELRNPPKFEINLPFRNFEIIAGDTAYVRVEANWSPLRYTLEPSNWTSVINENTIAVFPKEDTGFDLFAVNPNGCEDRDNFFVEVDRAIDLFLPDAFSPNDDANNDFYRAYPGLNLDEVESFQIYNRWGELLYEEPGTPKSFPLQGWDGRHQNRPMPPGVYVCTVTVEMPGGKVERFTKDFLLAR